MQKELASSINSWLVNFASIVVFCLFIIPIILIHSLNWINPPFSSFMLGHKLTHPTSSIDYDWKSLDEISQSAPLAIVAAEDQLFTQRTGFNINRLKQALKHHQLRLAVPSTSSISRNTAKNLFLWSDNMLGNGNIESWLAFLLETSLDKRRILEIYLNISEFTPGVYGVEATSRKFFFKPAKQLTDEEAASIAAVFSDPEQFQAYADSPSAIFEQRQRGIISEMKVLNKTISLQNGAKKPVQASFF